MKNLYPKSKGKIHPSPAAPSAATGDALSVLKLLPAAIFVLTAALSFEDKEVVAYLMIRSINGSEPSADAAEEWRRCRRIAGVHRPLSDCGCFDCYTSFWSRWDCSREREVIHMVIEAFEEHLASKEEKKGKAAKRKRKKSKDEKKAKEKEKERKDGEKIAEEEAAAAAAAAEEEEEESRCFEEAAVSVSEGCFAEVKEQEVEREVAEVVVELPAVSGEKRRWWADVVGMFISSRLWSLWSPGV